MILIGDISCITTLAAEAANDQLYVSFVVRIFIFLLSEEKNNSL